MQFIVRVIMRVLFGVAKARPSSRRMPRLGARRVLACLFRFFPSSGLICGSIANVEFRSAGAAGRRCLTSTRSGVQILADHHGIRRVFAKRAEAPFFPGVIRPPVFSLRLMRAWLGQRGESALASSEDDALPRSRRASGSFGSGERRIAAGFAIACGHVSARVVCNTSRIEARTREASMKLSKTAVVGLACGLFVRRASGSTSHGSTKGWRGLARRTSLVTAASRSRSAWLVGILPQARRSRNRISRRRRGWQAFCPTAPSRINRRRWASSLDRRFCRAKWCRAVGSGSADAALDVPAGLSAVSVPARGVQAVGGALRPGMRVDLYAVGSHFDDASALGRARARIERGRIGRRRRRIGRCLGDAGGRASEGAGVGDGRVESRAVLCASRQIGSGEMCERGCYGQNHAMRRCGERAVSRDDPDLTASISTLSAGWSCVRALTRRVPPSTRTSISEVWIVSSDEMSAVNLAAAIKGITPHARCSWSCSRSRILRRAGCARAG